MGKQLVKYSGPSVMQQKKQNPHAIDGYAGSIRYCLQRETGEAASNLGRERKMVGAERLELPTYAL